MNTKTHQQFVREMQILNSNIVVLGVYKNAHTKIEVKCLVCSHKWMSKPHLLLQKKGCPQCATATMTKSHDQFVADLLSINKSIKVTGTYTNARTKVDVECLSCHYRWPANPHGLLSSFQGCPRCRTSKGEKFIAQILEELDVYYETQKTFTGCHNKRQLRFDFFLPPKTLIEYDGAYHFRMQPGRSSRWKTLAQMIRNDRIKNKWTLSNGFELHRVHHKTSRSDIIAIIRHIASSNILKEETLDRQIIGCDGYQQVVNDHNN